MRSVWLLLACGACGFDLHVSITAATGSLQLDGKPIREFVIDRSFDSLDAAKRQPIPFEVEDGSGKHAFDLSTYISCSEAEGSVHREEIWLDLTYNETCPPEALRPGTHLAMCVDGRRCNGDDGTFSVPRE